MRLVLLVILLFSSLVYADTLSVFAASSLTEAFAEMASAFEAKHSDIDVELNFAGSSVLATQIKQGAPADVFASADEQLILGLEQSFAPVLFTMNRLVLLTNLESISSLEDLARERYFLVIANKNVPVGAYTLELLRRLELTYGLSYSERVLANVVSEETNVRQVLAKLLLGEADVAFVYATDSLILPDNSELRGIPIPDEFAVAAPYFMTTLETSKNKTNAELFVSFVLNEGQAILSDYGFSAIP